ncbi:hypothetical protein DAEQUDRAFT_738966 [Daedalea quercina L-15889]|uniref:Endonuclease/exonuclease/phosphatase domain-containing protein n=1 Tax=Daedalea quercina L-15889 TaxID=1314783 RepID=A0A165PCV5_9APHY|nr:hypothetical protein DAEQUDRAFT_738966 [Daedalea quercina L-15889]
MPTVLSDDWNLHHPLWSRTADPAKESTEQTVDWLVRNGYTIKNEKGTPTFFSHSHRTWSTLDLTFTNPAATELDVAKHWQIDEESSFGSDHFALRWTIDYGAAKVENVMGEKYNFKDTDPAKWRDTFRRALYTHAEPLQPLHQTDHMLSADVLDAAADALTNAMQDANAAAAKVRKPSDKARPWWNQELHNAAKMIADLRSQSLAHAQRWGTQAKADAKTHEATVASGLRLPDDPSSTQLIMYIDDGKIYVSSLSLDTNVHILKRAYDKVDAWLISVGLTPDLIKRELMHYSNRRRDKNYSPTITLSGANGTDTVIAAWQRKLNEPSMAWDCLQTQYGAYPKNITTQITALEIEAAIPPIRHHLNLVRDNAAIRLNKLGDFSPIIQRLPETWQRHRVDTPPPPCPTHRRVTARRRKPPASTRLNDLASLSDPQNERLEPLALPPWQ